MSLKHAFSSSIADGADTSVVRPSNWNAEHTIFGWDDLQGSVAQAAGASSLTFEAYRDTQWYCYFFRNDRTDKLYYTFQMPHDWDTTSSVEFHAHLVPMVDPASTQNVVISGSYAWSNMLGGTLSSASAWTSFSATLPVVSGSAFKQQYLDLFRTTAPTGTMVSSILAVAVHRSGGASGDTYTTNKSGGTGAANLAALSFDVHYIRNSVGTDTEMPNSTSSQTYLTASAGYGTNGTVTASGTIANNMQLLMVAGGGGGGKFDGGGGAGGVVYSGSYTFDTNSTYTITIGSGGLGSNTAGVPGSPGGNTIFSASNGVITAIGGGGGGSRTAGGGGVTGSNGGSGGGSSTADSNLQAGGTGTAGQGYNGGTGQFNSFQQWGGGGGGGAGARGGDATGTAGANRGGAGGIGFQVLISGSSSAYFAGGGGGGGYDGVAGNLPGSGGLGGGGSGSVTSGRVAQAGQANTGGGGGGGPVDSAGGAGGSGIVIVSYSGSMKFAGGTTVQQSGGYTIHKFTTSGMLIPTGSTVFTDTVNTVYHFYVSGTSAHDTRGNTWTKVGAGTTVNAVSGAYPQSIGNFSNGNYYASGSGNDAGDITGSFTMAVVFKAPAVGATWTANAGVLVSDGANGAQGYYLETTAPNATNPSAPNTIAFHSPTSYCIAAGTITSGSVHVAFAGRSGTTIFAQLDNGSTQTLTGQGTTPGTANVLKIGAYDDGGYNPLGSIAEVYFSTDVPSSASFAALYSQAKSKLGSLIP